MLKTYIPSESELLDTARAALRERKAEARGYQRHFRRAATLIGAPLPAGLSEILGAEKSGYIGDRPGAFVKPRFGTPAYAIAVKVGWIAAEEEKADREAWEERRARSLRSCHRYALIDEEPHQKGPPGDTGSYVPQLSARIENDPNLPDGARRLLRKIAEFAYRQNRERRLLDVTVSYLMKALGRSRRTIQRYLRVLEREGYILVNVVGSKFSRMCVGLEITLCRNTFAGHHREKWPPKRRRGLEKPGASKTSLNQTQFFSLESYKDKTTMYRVQKWALKCMDGVFRSLMKTHPLSGAVKA